MFQSGLEEQYLHAADTQDVKRRSAKIKAMSFDDCRMIAQGQSPKPGSFMVVPKPCKRLCMPVERRCRPMSDLMELDIRPKLD